MPTRVHDIAAPRRPERASPAGVPRGLALEEDRGLFLRMASHELRTPLNAVIGFSEILSKELYGPMGDPRYRDHAELVHQSGLRLLKLVNDLLDIARLQAGAMDLDLRPEPSGIAIEDALAGLRAEAAARDVVIHYAAEAPGPLILVDQRGFQRIVANLVQNAVAHAPPGGQVHVRVRAEGRRGVFEVTGAGLGVSAAELDRILRPMEEAESALLRWTEGAGLGLAIVGLLARSMQGRFSVRSAPGEGLTAVVEFPTVQVAEAVNVSPFS